jgi:hypothetical protein
MNKKPDPNCIDCGGLGEVTLPAHVRGGEIVDEEFAKCHCTIKAEEDSLEEEYPENDYDDAKEILSHITEKEEN